MTSIVADTHALIWYLLEPSKLSPNAHAAMKQANLVGTIYIPSIVIVELRYLVEKRTISETVFEFILDVITDPASSLEVVVLSLENARAIDKIPRSIVPDMPDRIIAITALELGLSLVTQDHKIIASGIATIW